MSSQKHLEPGDEVNFRMINMTAGHENMDSTMPFIDESGYAAPRTKGAIDNETLQQGIEPILPQ